MLVVRAGFNNETKIKNMNSQLFDKTGIELCVGHKIHKKLKEEYKWKKGYFEYPTGDLIITGDEYMEGEYLVDFRMGSFGTVSGEVFHPLFPNYNHWEVTVVGSVKV